MFVFFKKMSWIIKTTRAYSSIIKARVRTFFSHFSLKTGILIIAIHTLTIGIVLFLTLWIKTGKLTFDVILIPNDVKLVSGIFGSPLIFLGGILIMAYIKPKTGLLDGYIVNMQTLQCMFPMVICYLHIRTYLYNEIYYKNSYETRFNQDLLNDQLLFYVLIYFMLALAVISYFMWFYYIIVVISYKEEHLKALKMVNRYNEMRNLDQGRST